MPTISQAVPGRGELSKFVVNRAGWEAIRTSLYDFQAYAAAGVTTLTFFSLPIGQGGKTLSDTNMSLAGQLPTNQEFLVTNIQIHFFPGTPTVAKSMPSAIGAPVVATNVNDAFIFRRQGNLDFIIGSKSYLQEAPLMKFPPRNTFHLEGAYSGTTALSALANRSTYGDAAGLPYLLNPANLLLTSNQNFNVSLNWPEGVQAITDPARVGVVLDGFLYRRSQ